MSFIAAAIIGGAGALGSGVLGYLGSRQASQTSANMGMAALNQQKSMFGTAQKALQPFIDTGSGMLGNLTDMLTGSGPSNLLNNPVLKFMSQFGTMATTNALSSRGLGASAGPVATAVGNYNVGLADTFWKDVFERMSNVASMGGNAAGALASGAGTFSGQMGSTLSGIGNTLGSGIMGGFNALGGALTGGANSITNAMLLSKLFPGGGGGGMYATPTDATGGPGAIGSGGYNVIDANPSWGFPR